MAQSVEHATAAQTIPGSNQRHSLLFVQNLGNCQLRTDRKKTEDYVITLTCASVRRFNDNK